MRYQKKMLFVVSALFVMACGGGNVTRKTNESGEKQKKGNSQGKGNKGGGKEAGPVLDNPKMTPPPQPGAMDKLLSGVDTKLNTSSARHGSRYASYRRYRYGGRKGKINKKDKSNAPYFHTPGSKKQGVEELPLKKTSAKVQIAGVIAQVKVSQVYENKGKKPIEAIYVFPASTKAAVHGMRMKIGKRILEARIQEKKRARAIYEQAKKAGKRASLLEQERPNVFTMNVANIMPGDVIEVELDYSELLVPEDGIYEFVYPTVVGPRFAGGSDPKKDKWMKNPHLKAGKKEPYAFDISVHVESPIGIKSLSSPSHPVDVKFSSKTSADVALKKKGGGNRDYVLKYRLAGDSIETGILAFEGPKEKFFLLMMEPPKRVVKKNLPPREYIFLVDVSGSMYGFPLNTSKTVIRNLFKGMSSKDYFNVVLFAGSSRVLSPKSLRATKSNLDRVMNIIDRQRGGGGTQLLAGLKTAYGLPKVKAKGVSRSVVVITDGYVGVEKKTFRFINKRLNDANLFSFGIGSSVNRGLIEDMGKAGMGESFVVLHGQQAAGKAEKFKKYIEAPVLTDISVSYPGMKVSDVVPKRFPDLMAQRPLIAFGKYSGPTAGKVQVKGATGAGSFKKTMTLDASSLKPQNKPLRVLWARKWVAKLTDQLTLLPKDADLKSAITNVGLSYKLLTQFTSFVAVDLKQVRRNGKLVTVRQPLPMPKGVSNRAIGGKDMDSVDSVSSSYALGRRGRRVRREARKRHRYMSPMSRSSRSFSGGTASAETSVAALPASEPKSEEKSKSKATLSIKVLRLTNMKPKMANRLKRRIRTILAHRAAKMPSMAVKTVVVRVKVSPSGSVKVSGGNRSLRKIIQRVLQPLGKMVRLMKNTQLVDAGKPVSIRIRLRWR